MGASVWYSQETWQKKPRDSTTKKARQKRRGGSAHVAPVEALLRVVEELGRLHEDVAHIVADHDEGADAHQAGWSE